VSAKPSNYGRANLAVRIPLLAFARVVAWVAVIHARATNSKFAQRRSAQKTDFRSCQFMKELPGNGL
jgi:hypothetical protein